MTTERKTITGEIKEIAFKNGAKGRFAEVTLAAPGKRYGIKCRAFDPALVQRFENARKGMTVGLVIEEEPGTYVDDNGNTMSITYRNIVDVTSASLPVQPPDWETLKRMLPTQIGETPPGPQPSDDPTRDSIERQVALKSAVKYVLGHVKPGDEQDPMRIVEIADIFYDWIAELRHVDVAPTPQLAADSPGPPGQGVTPTDPVLTPLKNIGDLFKRCSDHYNKMTVAQVLLILKVKDKTEIADLEDAWATVRMDQEGF